MSDRASERWWTVRYCSADTAVLDVRGGPRVTVDHSGAAVVGQVAAGTPSCP